MASGKKRLTISVEDAEYWQAVKVLADRQMSPEQWLKAKFEQLAAGEVVTLGTVVESGLGGAVEVAVSPDMHARVTAYAKASQSKPRAVGSSGLTGGFSGGDLSKGAQVGKK